MTETNLFNFCNHNLQNPYCTQKNAWFCKSCNKGVCDVCSKKFHDKHVLLPENYLMNNEDLQGKLFLDEFLSKIEDVYKEQYEKVCHEYKIKSEIMLNVKIFCYEYLNKIDVLLFQEKEFLGQYCQISFEEDKNYITTEMKCIIRI